MSEYDATQLLAALADSFAGYEALGLMVGTIWLCEQDIALLATSEHFDRLDPSLRKRLMETQSGFGTPEGSFWAADVRCSLAIPDGHAAMAPDGMKVIDVGPQACVALNAFDKPKTTLQ